MTMGKIGVMSIRDEDTSPLAAPKPSSSTVNNDASPAAKAPGPSPSHVKQEFDGFDEFDPRVSAPAASNTANNNAEMDMLGSLSDSFPSNSVASMPANSTGFEADSFVSNTNFGASDDVCQPDFGFGDSFTTLSYTPSNSSQHVFHEIANPDDDVDILASILPPSGPSLASAVQTPFPAPNRQQLELGMMSYGDIGSHGGPAAATSQVSPLSDVQFNNGDFHHAPGFQASSLSASSSQSDVGAYRGFGFQAGHTSRGAQMSHPTQPGTDSHPYPGYYQHQMGSTVSSFPSQNGQSAQSSTNVSDDFGLRTGIFDPINIQMSLQSQAGTNMQFNEGSFKHEVGLSSSPFSDPSTNGQAMQLGNGNFASQAGPTSPVTSQTTATARVSMPLNDGILQHEARPLASPFSSSQSQNGQAILPNSGDFGLLQGPATTISSQVSPQAPAGINMPFNSGNFPSNAGLSVSSPHSAPLNQNGQAMQPFANGNFLPPGGSSVGSFSHNIVPQSSNGPSWQVNNNNLHQPQISGHHGVQHAPSEWTATVLLELSGASFTFSRTTSHCSSTTTKGKIPD